MREGEGGPVGHVFASRARMLREEMSGWVGTYFGDKGDTCSRMELPHAHALARERGKCCTIANDVCE